MAIPPISAKISIEGGDEAKRTFQEIGQAGQASFKQISDAAEQVSGSKVAESVAEIRQGFNELSQAASQARESLSVGQDISASLRDAASQASTAESSFTSFFSNLISGASSAATAVAGLGVAFSAVSGALSAVGIAAGNTVDNLGRTADKARLTIESYQELTAAALTSGKSAEAVSEGMRGFSDMALKLRTELALTAKRTAETGAAMGGAGRAARAAAGDVSSLGLRSEIYGRMFATLGINFRNFRGDVEDTERALWQMAKRLEEMPNGYKKAETIRTLGRIMGPDFAGLIAQGYTALKAQADAVDAIIGPITRAERALGEEVRKSGGLLDSVVERARARLGLLFAPFAAASQIGLAKFIGAAANAIDNFVKNNLLPAIETVRAFVKGLTGLDILPSLNKASQATKEMRDNTIGAAFAAADMEKHHRSVSGSLREAFASVEGMEGRLKSVDQSTIEAAFHAAEMDKHHRSVAQSSRVVASETSKLSEELKRAGAAGQAAGASLRENIWGSLQRTALVVGETIRGTFTNVWRQISDALAKSDLTTWEGVTAGALAAWERVKQAGADAIKWIADRISDIRANGWEGLSRTAADVWERIKQIASSAWDAITGKLSATDGDNIWATLLAGARRSWAAIEAFVAGAYERLKGAALAAYPGLRKPWELLEGAVKDAWNNIATLFTQGASRLRELLATVGLAGTWDFFVARAKAAFDSVLRVALTGYQAIRDGILGTVPELTAPWRAVEGVVKSVWASIGAIVKTAWADIKAFTGSSPIFSWEGLKASAQSAWDGIGAVVKGALSLIVAAVKTVSIEIDKAFGPGAGTTFLVFAGGIAALIGLFSRLTIATGTASEEAGAFVRIIGFLRGIIGGLTTVFGVLLTASFAIVPAFAEIGSAIAEGASPIQAMQAALRTLFELFIAVGRIVIGTIVKGFEVLRAAATPLVPILKALFGAEVSAEAIVIAGILLRLAGVFTLIGEAAGLAKGAATLFFNVMKYVLAGQLLTDATRLSNAVAGIGTSFIANIAALGTRGLIGFGLIGAAIALVMANFDKLESVAVFVLNQISGKGAQGAKDFAGAWNEAIDSVRENHIHLYRVMAGISSPIEVTKRLIDGTFWEWTAGMRKTAGEAVAAHAKMSEAAKTGADAQKKATKDYVSEAIAEFQKLLKAGQDASKAQEGAAAAPAENRKRGGFEEVAPGRWKLVQEEVKKAATATEEAFTTSTDRAGQAMTQLAEKHTATLQQMVAASQQATQSATPGAGAGATAADAPAAGGGGIADTLTQPFLAARTTIQDVLGSLAPLVQTALAGISEALAGVAFRIQAPFFEARNGVAQVLQSLGSLIATAFQSLDTVILSAAQSVQTAIGQILSALEAAVAKAQELARAAQEAAAAAQSAGDSGGQKFASGGLVSGPGTATSDSIRAWLSSGEFVMNARAVQRWGVGFMQWLNSGGGSFQLPRVRAHRMGFADGGLVPATGPAGGGVQLPGATVNLNVGGTRVPLWAPPSAAKQLATLASRSRASSAGPAPTWVGGK